MLYDRNWIIHQLPNRIRSPIYVICTHVCRSIICSINPDVVYQSSKILIAMKRVVDMNQSYLFWKIQQIKRKYPFVLVEWSVIKFVGRFCTGWLFLYTMTSWPLTLVFTCLGCQMNHSCQESAVQISIKIYWIVFRKKMEMNTKILIQIIDIINHVRNSNLRDKYIYIYIYIYREREREREREALEV